MKFMTILVLAAAAVVAADSQAEAKKTKCAKAGGKCNYSIFPAAECCPKYHCVMAKDAPPGAWGKCKKKKKEAAKPSHK